MSSRYEILSGLLLGFHGTDKLTAERVFAGKAGLGASKNSYDWLGHGTYFWEYGPQRAMEFAKEKKRRGEIKQPVVIGAVIDPGHCLNLLESSALAEIKISHALLELIHDGGEFPKNEGGTDLYKRHLDCAVFEMTHVLRESDPKNPLPPYDTVRGAFWEGKELYPNAGFKQKNHVQICVRNPDCIKGYFRVIP